MKQMKQMKKVALLLCAVFVIGMVAGCSSFDASAYLKAVLDNSYKNDPTGFVDQKIATKEEADKLYEDGLDQELDSFMTGANVKLSDDVKENFRGIFADLFKAADYKVGEAKKQSDGSYEVTVEYKTLKVFKNAYATYSKKLEDIDASKFESQQEVYDAVFQTLADCLKDELASPEYGDTQTMDITISIKDKLYTPDENDLATLEQALFDMDQFGE